MEIHGASFPKSVRRPVWMPTGQGFHPSIHAVSTGKKTSTPHVGKTLPVASRLLRAPHLRLAKTLAARSFAIASTSTSTSAELEWEEAREPLHADIDTAKTCGVGPGMVFARAVLPRLEAPGVGVGVGVGLVPCAVGGTAIREWARGERLYDQMVRRARAAAECGEIEAVLWYQGESDAESDAETAAYQGNVERLIANVRADLGMPQLPFIQVALASGNKRNIEKVRKAQLNVNLPNVVTVDAIGLALNEDNLHLTTESQVKLGEMLAQAYINNFLPATC